MAGGGVGAAAGAVLVALLAGCEGAADATAAPEFVSCVEEAGLSLSGQDEWEQSEWTEFFTRPEALTCAVDDLGQADRETALQEAFGRYWEEPDDLYGSAGASPFDVRLDALGDYAAATARDHGRAAATDGGLALVQSLEWSEGPDADRAVLVMLVAALHARGELPGLDAFLQENDGADRGDYGAELLNGEGQANDRFRELYDELIGSFDASRLAP